ncbi:LysR family transcriptional regulator [Streptomyces chromofuscus]|uniref:LysR family transcriptional regulator n=1 Tax=Streptomyces chromofuscus TaxID=42881 RepID=UPI001673E539|nr:LysR family transcriptional regulator [Streptomyces chromofuscus]GGT03467.1 LysR family transcriptional regulator [Streptomyces chromofuscus]
MEVELRHLRAFSAVARLRSFSGAARDLSITQPALSRTIAQLEDELSVRLLDRTSRRVDLTDAGAEFLPHAERVLSTFGQALAAARRTVTLRLGFSWLLPDPWAQRAMSGFEAATGTSVTLTRTDDPVRALHQRTVDIAVVRGDASPPQPVRTVHLYDEERIAVCARQFPMADRGRLDWTEVQQWPLVVNTVSGTTGPGSWPADQRPQEIVETANYDEWVETVAAGRGIGIVPEVARRRTPHPALRFVTLTNAPPIPVSLIHLPDGPRTLVRRFLDAAVAAAQA